MNVRFDIGETRHVRIEVFSKKNEEFTIKNALYELSRKGGTQIEDSGSVCIVEHVLDVVISPKFSGYYELKVIYTIADEKLIEIIEIYVKE